MRPRRSFSFLNASLFDGKLLANNSTVKFCLPRPASSASVILHAAITRYSPKTLPMSSKNKGATASIMFRSPASLSLHIEVTEQIDGSNADAVIAEILNFL